jgi:hypothetical protein
MMRDFALKAVPALAALWLAAPASAAEPIALPASPHWVVCSASAPASNRKWVSDVYEDFGARVGDGQDRGWAAHVRSKFQVSRPLSASCSAEDTREDAIWRHAVLTDPDPIRPATIVEVADWNPDFGRKADMRVAELPAEGVELASLGTNDVPAPVARQAPQTPGPRIADGAEFERRNAEYQQRLADQQREVEAYRLAQADVAQRKERQHLAAANAVATYAQQVQSHDADLARYRARLATLDH